MENKDQNSRRRFLSILGNNTINVVERNLERSSYSGNRKLVIFVSPPTAVFATIFEKHLFFTDFFQFIGFS